MRIRVTAATAALLLTALTACGSSDDDDTTAAKKTADTSQSVDCTSQTLGQAEWAEHCGTQADTDDDAQQTTGLTFGKTYTWPDGLKATVVSAKVFTDYDPELLESAEPGSMDFRVTLKIENTGDTAADLGDLSLIIEGATNGGEAAATSLSKGSLPLEGRLAPGVTVTKNDDNALETKYGRKIVVTVQRASDDFSLDFPEFEGEITG